MAQDLESVTEQYWIRYTMARVVLISLALVVCLVGVHSAPQFGGGFSQANAQAQAGSFGYGGGYRPFQGPSRPPFGPGFGGPGYGRPGFGGSGFGRGLNNGGGSISISKSISISRGGGGVAQSSAQSGAVGK